MPNITFVKPDGTRVETSAETGLTLMNVAVNAGIDAIAAECGGACACGTCHCFITPEFQANIPAPNDDETDMLDFVIDPTADSRLSCQITITDDMDGLIVNVPDSQT